MSVQALGWVLDHSPSVGAERLVLISLANHAGVSPVDGAWESYPGIALISREAGFRSRPRTVSSALQKLEEAGAIQRVLNGAPDNRIRPDRRPNLYRIMLERGEPCEGSNCAWCGVSRSVTPQANGVSANAERDVVSRATGCRETPNGVSPNDTQTIIKPSLEPSNEPVSIHPEPDCAWCGHGNRQHSNPGNRCLIACGCPRFRAPFPVGDVPRAVAGR